MAWLRLRTLSFFKIFDTCAFTVASDSDSSQAMILFGLPFTSWRNTVVSAGDSRRRSSFASEPKFCALEPACERYGKRGDLALEDPLGLGEIGVERGGEGAVCARPRRVASESQRARFVRKFVEHPQARAAVGGGHRRKALDSERGRTFNVRNLLHGFAKIDTVHRYLRPRADGSAYSELFVRIIY